MAHRLFITGIPTSGKSYLARKLAKETGGIAVILDDFREKLATDERYRRWTNFYLDQDEKKYFSTTTPDEQWNNLVMQSEGLWPALAEKIAEYENESKPVIFECVNILPHIAKKHLNFPGVVLTGSSYEEVLERNMAEPRWGSASELQELEAKAFFYNERPRYKAEAEKYGYPVFEKADDAIEAALQFLA